MKLPPGGVASLRKSESGQRRFRWSAGIPFLFRIEQLRETGIFLKEVEVFIIASVVAVRRTEINGDFQIGERRIGFAREAVESGERIVDVVGFRGKLAGPLEAFPSFVPAAEIHHGNTALVVILRRLGILLGRRLHALLGDAKVRASAIGQFPTWASDDLFEFLFGTLELLLMEETHGLLVGLHLGLDQGVDEFDSATLGWRGRYIVLFLGLSLGVGG